MLSNGGPVLSFISPGFFFFFKAEEAFAGFSLADVLEEYRLMAKACSVGTPEKVEGAGAEATTTRSQRPTRATRKGYCGWALFRVLTPTIPPTLLSSLSLCLVGKGSWSAIMDSDPDEEEEEEDSMLMGGESPTFSPTLAKGRVDFPDNASDSSWEAESKTPYSASSSSARKSYRPKIPPRQYSNLGGEDAPLRKRGVRCMECPACLRKDDCGKCEMCRDKKKFGGPGVKKQACM